MSTQTAPAPQHIQKQAQDQYHLWKAYNTQGNQLHQQNYFDRAIECFKKSILICKKLTPSITKTDPLEMLHISSHNLAACYNATGQGLLAKSTLDALHEYLINLAKNTKHPRQLRLRALANINKSLFSLSSQLSYLNQTNEIHRLIRHTEESVTDISTELLC